MRKMAAARGFDFNTACKDWRGKRVLFFDILPSYWYAATEGCKAFDFYLKNSAFSWDKKQKNFKLLPCYIFAKNYPDIFILGGFAEYMKKTK